MKRRGKRILASIQMRGTIPLNNGLFFALDSEGNGRLHNNSTFHGYTGRWATAKRGACWRARVFGSLRAKYVLCDSPQDALLALIRLAQEGGK
jgi:hypothetical protein